MSCFPKIGYREGSSSSSMFYIKTVWPFLMAFSRILRKLGSESLVTCICWSLYILLIHLFACPCGSMIKGHLLQLKIKIPLSVDKVSVGSPYYCQSLICTYSDRILSSRYLSDTGIWSDLHFYFQSPIIFCLYSNVNGPVYATEADDNMMFPIKLLKSYSSFTTFTFHLSAYPAKPPTSFSALTSWIAAIYFCSCKD